MKKIYFSLITIGILLFAACTNDVPGNQEVTEGGSLEAKISFDAKTLRAASSTAIPTVSWANVKQVQLFLYDKASGEVKFSHTVTPTSAQQKFSWTNVPAGTYRLALLANVKSNTDDIVTWVNGTKEEFTNYNVIGKVFNASFNTTQGLQIDLKEKSLPTSPTIPHVWGTSLRGYAAPSEIFTAYSEDVEIKVGETTVVPELQLKREISLLRARFNIKEIPVQPDPTKTVHFDNSESNFIAIQRLPVGFGLKVGTFAGGVMAASDVDRVLVGSVGADTYKNTDPATGYNPNKIIDSNFTLWHDIRVLPNASLSENLDKEADASSSRRYFIIIGAWVDAGYKFADGTVASENKAVYWAGTINGVFTKNVIREVNMTLKTPGYPIIPEPEDEGGLEITIGLPENWDSVIVNTDIEA
ncbi:hypothetical protein [Proteiniphilum sp. X52]|uniref:hypothetical protein n=1 Tax=Proteiniphilum sp. X52 TaxID=2382159 RepID=UPI0011CDBA5F|nr:hypothetical protein [Proteiniphilum sp. X52]